MKFQPDKFDVLAVTGYGPGWVAVNGQKVTHSLLLSSSGIQQDWDCTRYEDLGPGHFERLLALAPETVIFGSGTRIRFPNPQWLRPLYERRIGLETMDSQAACRTYNILAGEGRSVVLVLLQEQPG